MWTAGSATLEHVLLKRSPLAAPVARLRLSYLLSSVTFRPPAMPPSALLIVRSMKDPLPGRIAREFDVAATPSFEWESAAQSELGALYRRAGRPAWEAVPLSAEAVLFTDYGELLACLALDLLRGSANSWWWRSILRRFPSRLPGAWAEVWAEHPLYIPAALQQLDERSEAVAVLERIAPAQAWQFLLAVLRAYALPEIALMISEIMARPVTRSDFAPESRVQSSSSEQDVVREPTETFNADERPVGRRDSKPWSDHARGGVQPPWEPYIAASSIPARLGTARRALLGVSLLLRRAPQAAFTATFALRLRTWLAEQLERENPSAGGDEPLTPATSAVVLGESLIHAESIAAESAPGGPGRSSVLGSSHAKGSKRKGADLSIAKAGLAFQPDFENGVPTRAGGVFYLIHLLLQADLLRFNTGLSGWALLDLLARCLLDQSFRTVSDDPIWAALELLDGRDAGVSPGSGFQPQTTYEAPESWLRELDSSAQYVHFRSGRVEIWNPEGFLTVDSQSMAALTRAGLHPLTRGQRRAWRNITRVRPMHLPLSRELRRFLHFVLPYARWRLKRALRGTSVREVLLRAGTVYVSATHVDVVMGMTQVSLPVRLAGLDANPGWVPELGRVVTFHFVQEGFGSE